MTTFDDREKAFENKFKYDEEMKFKATARRNRLIGLWAAEKLGKAGADADGYAKDVIEADFKRPGDEDVIEKLLSDFAAANIPANRGDIVFELERFFGQAMTQLKHEA